MENLVMEDKLAEQPIVPLRLLLRPEEGARALGVSRARIYEMLARGDIRSIKIGRSRRIPVAEIKNWIDAEIAEQSA